MATAPGVLERPIARLHAVVHPRPVDRDSMELILQVNGDLALALRGGSRSAEAAELERAARELGVSLEPMHAGVEDESLTPFLTVAIPDPETGQRIAERLRRCQGVEAAYIKPADEPP